MTPRRGPADVARVTRPTGEVGRPSLSPMLWLGAVAWVATIAGTELALVSWTRSSTALAAAALAVSLGLLVAAARIRRLRALRMSCVVAAVALAVAVGRGAALPLRAAQLEAAGPGLWSATVVGDPRDGAFGTSVAVSMDAAPGMLALMSVPKGAPPPRYGSRIGVAARIRVVARGVPASGDAFRSTELLRVKPWRIEATGWAPGPLGPVAQWRARVLAALRADGLRGETLAAMLFAVAPSQAAAGPLQDARTAGVAWAITTSGLHLGALVLVVDRLAALLGLGRRGRAAAALIACGVLVIACAFKVSLLRAAFAVAAGVLARAFGRRRDGTAALGVVVLALMVCDPGAAYDVGLLLGAVAVLAIGLFGALARTWLRPLVGRSAASVLGASVAAQVAVAPLSASLFGGIALLGPVVLVVSAPLVETAVALGFVGAALLPASGALARPLLAAAAWLCSVAAAVWSWFARVRGAFVPTAAVPAAVGAAWASAIAWLWVRWPLPKRAARVRIAAIACAGALALGALIPRTVSTGLVVLDVGQGDAVLIRDGAHSVLVDTGPDALSLRRALARAGVREIEGLVLTHAHEDHTGGLAGLAGVAAPGWIGVPDVEDDAVDALALECGRLSRRVVRLRRDMRFAVGRTSVRVLWPKGGERALSANDTSVILLVTRDDGCALLLGDAEDRAQMGALEAWAGRADVVKVAHHGSPNGNVPEALAVWRPAVALISVGAGNSFGHPSRAALDTLASVGAVVHRTDREGDLGFAMPHGVARPAPVGTGSLAAPAVTGGALCDNRSVPVGALPHARLEGIPSTWLLPISPISNRSTSSTARRSCCSSVLRSGSATGSPPWRTSTSTWRPSTVRPPPRVMS